MTWGISLYRRDRRGRHGDMWINNFIKMQSMCDSENQKRLTLRYPITKKYLFLNGTFSLLAYYVFQLPVVCGYMSYSWVQGTGLSLCSHSWITLMHKWIGNSFTTLDATWNILYMYAFHNAPNNHLVTWITLLYQAEHTLKNETILLPLATLKNDLLLYRQSRNTP